MRAFRPPSVRESRADRTGNRPDGKTKVPSGTAEVEYKMAFRDHRGQSLQTGDTVAFVFHPAVYVIKLTRGIITDINETRATLWLMDNTSCGTMSSHGVITKLTKIPGYVPEQDSPLDAAGQPVAMGNTVVFQAPLTMNG